MMHLSLGECLYYCPCVGSLSQTSEQKWRHKMLSAQKKELATNVRKYT